MFHLRKWHRLTKTIRNYYTVNSDKAVKDPNPIAKQLIARIKATGPITVADYMKEVLINPIGGYYMHKDMFGENGDFITSPEINQMFGEMVAVWFLNEWSKMGSPKPFQIVELGPGRGTLSQDLLRVFSHFGALKEGSLNLMEVSPTLSDMQSSRLCLKSENALERKSEAVFYKQGVTHEGIPVKWFKQFDDVPQMFTLLVAHEFFDALPIHKFKKTYEGYREVLVDIDPEKEGGFRHVMAKNETPISQLLVKKTETRENVEISTEALILAQSIAKRIESDGGLALIVDYGHNGSGTDTFRAFRKHKLHDPLVEPGTADLTADVDFGRIKETCLEQGGVLAYGPISQRNFLLNIGIEERYKALAENIKPEHSEALKFGYKMITDAEQMGERFKFMALLPAVLKKMLTKYPPAGFK